MVMTSKEVVEAILAINPSTYDKFRACHLINDEDRRWTAVGHPEYPFIKYFFDPHFIVIISKRIYVYIVLMKC
jgi:hypothetical protein